MLEAQFPVAIFANAIGDHLLSLPALRALVSLFPGRLALICARGAGKIFYSDLPLRAIYEVDIERIPVISKITQKETFTRTFDAEAVAQSVGPCDLLLSLNTWHSPAVDRLLQCLSPAGSIGFYPSFQVFLPLDFSKHSADLEFDLPRYLDLSLRVEGFAIPPTFSVDIQQQARQLRAAVPAPLKLLAVHAETWPEKMWVTKRLISVLGLFLDRHPDFVIAAVGLQELGLNNGKIGERVLPCFGLPLSLAMAVVGQADLFLGIDSCMLHAADLFQVPGVGLFGPTDWHQWGFRFGPHRHIQGKAKMDTIRELEVLEALESLLAETNVARRGSVVSGDV